MANTFGMSMNAFDTLPEELADDILKRIPRGHLPVTIIVSKFFQRLATPLLYQNIEVCTVRESMNCCRTLARSRFDVAAMVRSLSIRPQDASCKGGATEAEASELRLLLPLSVKLMARLECLICTLPGSLTRDMCTAMASLRTLRVVDVVLASGQPGTPELTHPPLPGSALVIHSPAVPPSVEAIYIRHALTPLTADQSVFFKSAFSSRRLREIVIGVNCPGSFLDFLPSRGPLESLTTLTLPTLDQEVLSYLYRMPSLRSLALCPWSLATHKTTPDLYQIGDLDGQRGLSLDGLCCSSSMLPSLVPVIGGLRHIRLDGASYLPDSLTHAFPWGMHCDDATRTFMHLAKYSETLRYLAIMIHQPQNFVIADHVPVFPHLETLVVRVRLFTRTLESTSSYICKVFAHTPRLKTLLISQDSSAIMMCNEEPLSEQVRVVQEWAKACPTLETIALSWKYIWSKVDDKWSRKLTLDGYVPAQDNVRYASHRC